MEGWFWRFTDTTTGHVVVALCGINRHPDGDWGTVALAAHPGDFVVSTVVPAAVASADRYEIRAGDVLRADERSLTVELANAQLHVELKDLVGWPLRLGAGGVLSALPWLGQYWQPHALGGRSDGALVAGCQRWSLAGADVYAEKNWGAGFPEWWWWGQGQGFSDRQLCVAFGGGRLRMGPVALGVTGCVLRHGRHVVRFAPPFAKVRADVSEGRWQLTAQRRGWRLALEGRGADTLPTVLPVPLPSKRRNVDRDLEHLAADISLQVWHGGRQIIADRTRLGALEVGSTDRARIEGMAEQLGIAASRIG